MMKSIYYYNIERSWHTKQLKGFIGIGIWKEILEIRQVNFK
jgi:hypothetical protein